MSNSFFNFNESPDWASAIAATYESFNASQDRAEELEKENDKRRIENAGVPLKLIKEVMEFSPTLKKVHDGLQEREKQWALSKSIDGIPEEELENSRNALGEVFKFGKGTNYIKKAANDNNDPVSYNLIDYSGEHGARRKWLDMQDIIEGIKSNFTPWLTKNYPTAFGSPTEYTRAFGEYKSQIEQNVDKLGFNTRFFKSQTKDTFKDLKSTFFSTQNTKLTQRNVSKEQSRMINEVTKALNSDNPQQAFTETSTYNVGFFNGNLADSNRAFVNIGLMGVKAGVINPDKFESVLFGEVTAKGDKIKLLIEKLGGGPESTLWATGILTELDDAKRKIIENIETDNSNYGKQYELDLRKENGPDGKMTKAEIVDYIYTNPETRWDHTRGNIPQSVLKMISKEAGLDAEWLPTVQKKAKLGLLTVEDVMRLEDINLRRQYMPAATAGNNFGLDVEAKARMKQSIGILATTYTDDKDADNRSPKWDSVQQQSELAYPSIYARLLREGIASSPVDAHAKTMAILKEKVYNGDFDKWSQESSNTLKLLSAAEYIRMDHNKLSEIKDAFNNNTYTKILPGFEDDIKQALELPAGSTQVLTAFKQLGERYGIPGAVIQHNQVTLAKLLKGEKEPIKSEVVLAFEKLPKDQQELLGKFTTQSKLARAKFLAFKQTGEGEEEGTITWLEMQTIHPDVAKFIYKEETGRDDYPVTPTLGKFEPRKGDWKKLPGATRIGYTVWDGKEWKYSSSRGKKNQEWIGGVEDYKDVDGYYKPFEGRSNDLTTTFFGGDEPINTAEEGGPRAGDWYKVTNKNIGAMNIGDLAGGDSKPYVVWNGKEWVYSAVKGRFPKEYQGPQPLSKIDEEEKLKESLRQQNY